MHRCSRWVAMWRFVEIGLAARLHRAHGVVEANQRIRDYEKREYTIHGLPGDVAIAQGTLRYAEEHIQLQEHFERSLPVYQRLQNKEVQEFASTEENWNCRRSFA